MAPPSIYTEEEILEMRRKKIEKAKQVRQQYFENEYRITNKRQIRALAITGMRVWLLQGPQLVKVGALVNDVFFTISSYLLKLNSHETKYIYEAVHNKLFKDTIYSIKKNNMRFFGIFQNEKNSISKQQKTVIRYVGRKYL